MEKYLAVKNKIVDLFGLSVHCSDSAESVILEGVGSSSLELPLLLEIYELLEAVGSVDVVRLSIDNDPVEREDLILFQDQGYGYDSWKLVFNKFLFSSRFGCEYNGIGLVFFLTDTAYDDWVSGIDPLSACNNFFLSYEAVVIFSPSVHSAFGGPRISVQPLRDIALAEGMNLKDSLPEEKLVREYVHLVPSEPIKLSPRSFALNWGALDDKASEAFRVAAAVSIAATLPDVIYNKDCVVLKGIRHLEMPVKFDEGRVPTATDLNVFESACIWVYNERIDTRKKLLNDRITLEAEEESSLLELLCGHLDSALKQSKDQYRFVILDRKDEYAKELRDLLKDLREQAELYADKIRGLIFGLLRDILAAFVFVALALSSRVGANLEIMFSDVGILFFKALSVYFFSSLVLQVSAAAGDILLADRELQRWTTVTRDYISKSELEQRISKDLFGRRVSFWMYLALVSLAYVIMGFGIWNIHDIVTLFIGME